MATQNHTEAVMHETYQNAQRVLLPEKLHKGMLMASRNGCMFRPKPTRNRDGLGARLYRLEYERYGTTPSETWTRDGLQAEGTVIKEETGQ